MPVKLRTADIRPDAGSPAGPPVRYCSLLSGLLALLCSFSLPASDVTNWQDAIQNNEAAGLRRLMTSVRPVDQPTQNGKTALMAAAALGDVALLRALLAAGADPNVQNRAGGTPLMYAVAGRSRIGVDILLAAGADANAQSSNGWSPLMMAAAKNHALLTARLCQAGANVNTTDVYGWTPLMRAAYEGYSEVVDVLLQQPAIELERINDHGQTALHLAVIGGQTDTVRALIAHGAQERGDFEQRTPGSIAASMANQAIIDLLKNSAPLKQSVQH